MAKLQEEIEKQEQKLIDLFSYLNKRKDRQSDWAIYFMTKNWGDVKFLDKIEFDNKVAEFAAAGKIDTGIMYKDKYAYKEEIIEE